MACRNRLLHRIVVGLLLLVASAGAPAADQPGPKLPLVAEPGQRDRPPQYGWRLDGSAFLRLGEGLETPHTKWMKPAATGAVRALFLANRIAAYDVPELGRRFDMNISGMSAETWLRMGDSYWLWMWIESSSSSERSAHFEQLLDEEYDVIVLGNYRFASLYESVQYKILEKVANGTGLVMFYAHDHDPRLLRQPVPGAAERIANGVPFAGLDFYRDIFMIRRDLIRPSQIGKKLLGAYRFGRGRVLVVDYGTQSSVFMAVPGAITPFEDYSYTAPVQYDYHQALAARCLMWAAGREPRLTWTTRVPDGIEVPALGRPKPIDLGFTWTGPHDESLSFTTRVRNRWNDVLRERMDEVKADSDAASFKLQLDPLPGGLHFVDVLVSSNDGVENWASLAIDVRAPLRLDIIEPASSFFERDQPVTGRVILSRPVADDEQVEIALTLEDGYGRLFSTARAQAEPGADRVAFTIPQGNLVAWGGRLRITLLLEGQPLHQDEVEVWFRRPDRGAFPIAMWGAIPGYGNHIGNLQMRRLGFTAVLADSPINQARDDLGWMTFGAGRGALIHSLGDEIPVPTPRKGEAFTAFIQKRYASLDELNAAWGTEFESWEAIEPSYRATENNPGSFVRAHDSMACGEWMHAERCRIGRERCEKANPPGVVGPEGSPVGDPELTLPEVTFWGPYLTVRDNLLVNAIADPDILRGNWFGGYVEDRQVYTRLRHVLWLSILGGNNMIEYFTISSGLLAPDLTMMPFTAQFMKSWHQLRRGLGRQLATCRPSEHPVAVLHSQPSEHIGRLGGKWTDTTKVHEYTLNLLGDAGYSPTYVATGQVKAGRLRAGDVKVLLLLHAFALSDDEIAEIVAFAERGGTVIADIPPAWFDGSCRLRGSHAMDDFFGLEPVKPAASLARRLAIMDNIDTVSLDGETMLLRGRDAELLAADGEPVAGIIEVPHGHGRAVLLNGVIWDEGRDDAGTALAIRQLLEGRAGVPRSFEVQFDPPLNKPGVKVYSYRRDDIRIDAVLPPEATDPDIPVKPLVTWPDRRHTYDLRTETYLGHVQELRQHVDRSSPLVVARLDYQVDRVELNAPTDARQGDVVSLTCSLMDAEGHKRAGHVIRIEIENPAGEACPFYGAMLRGDEPEQSWRIPFALNDPTGKWIVTATDVISGKTASTTITLQER